MPTYDYVCRACEHAFELFQSMSDPVKRKCPKCGRLRLERLIGTGAGVIFKGSGFYQTDYRSEKYSKAAQADRQAQSGEPDKTKAKDGAQEKSAPESKAKKTPDKSTDSPAPKSSKKD